MQPNQSQSLQLLDSSAPRQTLTRTITLIPFIFIFIFISFFVFVFVFVLFVSTIIHILPIKRIPLLRDLPLLLTTHHASRFPRLLQQPRLPAPESLIDATDLLFVPTAPRAAFTVFLFQLRGVSHVSQQSHAESTTPVPPGKSLVVGPVVGVFMARKVRVDDLEDC